MCLLIHFFSRIDFPGVFCLNLRSSTHLLTPFLQRSQSLHEQTHQASFQLLHMDYDFHRLLAEGSGNSWLMSLLDQVFDQMVLLRIRTTQHNPGVLEIRGEYRRVYTAIVARDVAAATQAIRDHLTASKARVVQEVQQLEQELVEADLG
jgi:DNA-binding FadR family transcriptional regulator